VGPAGRAVGISRATAFRRLLACRAALVDGTLQRLGEDLRLPREELESLLRTVRSKLELSLGGLLRDGSEG
jgi:CBS-domain-containing membrane protein